MNAQINSFASLKKLNKKQLKFQQKPWISQVIQNSIHKKSRLFKKYIKCNSHNNQNALHNEHKAYRNNLSTLMKKGNKLYYTNYFKNNIKDMKNKWKGIKSIIYLKAKEFESPQIVLNNKGEVLTNHVDIASSFKNFFILLDQTSNLILSKRLTHFIII